MTTSFQASNVVNNSFNGFFADHICGNGCLTCMQRQGIQGINTYPYTSHICQGNPCSICNAWNYSTFTSNMIMCPLCNVLYFAGCYHQCAGGELAAVKLELAMLKEEAVKRERVIERYKSLLEEFKLAIEAETK